MTSEHTKQSTAVDTEGNRPRRVTHDLKVTESLMTPQTAVWPACARTITSTAVQGVHGLVANSEALAQVRHLGGRPKLRQEIGRGGDIHVGCVPWRKHLSSVCLSLTKTSPSLHRLLSTPCAAAKPGADAVLTSLPSSTLAMAFVHSGVTAQTSQASLQVKDSSILSSQPGKLQQSLCCPQDASAQAFAPLCSSMLG